jgi:hypothetical protein
MNEEIGKVYKEALEAIVRILHNSGGSFAPDVAIFDRKASQLADVLATRQRDRIKLIEYQLPSAGQFRYRLARLLRNIRRDIRNEYQLGLVGTLPLNRTPIDATPSNVDARSRAG